jgi:hypothetical protein
MDFVIKTSSKTLKSRQVVLSNSWLFYSVMNTFITMALFTKQLRREIL